MTSGRLVLTPGEPAGIGPDICLLLALRQQSARLLAIADPDLLTQRARQLGIAVQIDALESARDIRAHTPGHLQVLPEPLAQTTQPGQLDVRNATYVLNCLRRATRLCLTNACDALVTGPVNKAVINDAGINFTGHTEFLAELTGASLPVMMLATEGLRVALASIHIPLQAVPAAITRASLTMTLGVLHHDLVARFGIPDPHILVAGLNPHAGENGYLGHEEIDTIEPVVSQLRSTGMRLTGPLPADTLFTPSHLASADAVLAMYHDQGLPVIKHLGFGRTVNVTLGLPIIRTSVDHGTALDLAGSGQIDTGSLQAAIDLAASLNNRQP